MTVLHRPLSFLLLMLALVSPVSALDVPYLTGRINDHASLLSQEAAQRLDTRLAALEQATGAQVAVLTLPTLEGESLEELTVRVARTWKLGRKDVNDGVLVFVSRDDRKLRIEVGYGLEGVLTDAATSRIISRLMVPRFREGDFSGGIESAVAAIDGAIRGEAGAIPSAGAAPSSDGKAGFDTTVLFFIVPILAPFMYFALVLKGFGGWFIYGFLAIFIFAFAQAFGEDVGITAAGIWLVSAFILRFLVPKRWRLESDGEGGGSGGGSRHRFSSRSSSSSSSFSGGGGSFGGGGASGSW